MLGGPQSRSGRGSEEKNTQVVNKFIAGAYHFPGCKYIDSSELPAVDTVTEAGVRRGRDLG